MKLRVLHISTYGGVGGAGRAALRLHQGLLNLGVDSVFAVKYAERNYENINSLFPSSRSVFEKLSGRVLELRTRRQQKYLLTKSCNGLFSSDHSRFRYSFKKHEWNCDIINLHWVAGDFFDYEGFFSSVPANIPVVWTLHDMNPFTGGCHYDQGCGRYQGKCGACPLLQKKKSEIRNQKSETCNLQPATNNRFEHDLSRKIWERKNRAIQRALNRGVKIHVVSPSKWLAECGKTSSLFSGLNVSVIPYGLDVDVFRPYSSTGLRKALGVTDDSLMVLFVSQYIDDPRKGLGFLYEAIRIASNRVPVALVGIGHKQQNHGNIFDFPNTFVGQIDSDRLLATLYSAADVFAAPSLQDNLPNTVLESMACGTPVVGFKVGGMPDMVINDLTGKLVSLGDASALADALVDVGRRGVMDCRRYVEQHFSMDQQASCYESLYKNVINGDTVESCLARTT